MQLVCYRFVSASHSFGGVSDEKDKIYRTVLKFGCETNTQDGAGQVTATTALPTLNKAEFCAVAKQFVGEIQQIPPIYSAIKKDGQPLYKLARQGIARGACAPFSNNTCH